MATSSKREWFSCLSSHQLPNAPQMDMGLRRPFSHPCWSFAWLMLMPATAMLCPEASISQLSSQPCSLYFLSSPSFEKFPSLGQWATNVDEPTTAEHSTLVWLFNQLEASALLLAKLEIHSDLLPGSSTSIMKTMRTHSLCTLAMAHVHIFLVNEYFSFIEHCVCMFVCMYVCVLLRIHGL